MYKNMYIIIPLLFSLVSLLDAFLNSSNLQFFFFFFRQLLSM